MKKGLFVFFIGLLCSVPLHAAETNAPDYPSFLIRGNNLHLPVEVRARLIELLGLPKDKLWEELQKWPTFQQMTLQEQAGFLSRLSELRQKARNQAMRKAAELGLTLKPEEQDAFIRAYLQERIDLDKKFAEATQATHRTLEDAANAHLTAQFADHNSDHKTPETR